MSLVAKSVLQPCGWSTNKNPWIKNPGANISTRKRPIYREINQQIEKEPSNSHGLRSGPSVGPYPPLRLVPTTEPTILQPKTQGPIINPTTA